MRGVGVGEGRAHTGLLAPPLASGSQEEQQRLAEQRLQEEQQKKAREAAAASKSLNVTVDVQVRRGHWSREAAQYRLFSSQ